MTLDEAREEAQTIYDEVAALNARLRAAPGHGLRVSAFIHDAPTGPMLIVNVLVIKPLD